MLLRIVFVGYIRGINQSMQPMILSDFFFPELTPLRFSGPLINQSIWDWQWHSPWWIHDQFSVLIFLNYHQHLKKLIHLSSLGYFHQLAPAKPTLLVFLLPHWKLIFSLHADLLLTIPSLHVLLGLRLSPGHFFFLCIPPLLLISLSPGSDINQISQHLNPVWHLQTGDQLVSQIYVKTSATQQMLTMSFQLLMVKTKLATSHIECISNPLAFF